jgi:hypothetical protein
MTSRLRTKIFKVLVCSVDSGFRLQTGHLTKSTDRLVLYWNRSVNEAERLSASREPVKTCSPGRGASTTIEPRRRKRIQAPGLPNEPKLGIAKRTQSPGLPNEPKLGIAKRTQARNCQTNPSSGFTKRTQPETTKRTQACRANPAFADSKAQRYLTI